MITIETLRANATKFANNFANANYEMGQAQTFIIGLCKVFELDYIRAVRFEDRVKKAKGKGRIDAFFPGLLLVEMKSAGKDLEDAYNQATDYFHGLKNEDLPRCVLVSDFQNLHLYNQETKEQPLKIKLSELPQYIERFRFLTGYQKIVTERHERINKEAAEKMADLHDAIKATGYTGKDLESYLVRLLFCLFAEDTGLFGENGLFLNYLQNWTQADGSDLHGALSKLFDTLNTADDLYFANHPDYKGKKRLTNLPQHLKDFSYINGTLFEGGLAECYFDESARNTLIECAELDWSEISPAIFGSLFQAIMHFDDELATAKTKKRREFGAHYTSEENILKTINPLFMDDCRAEFEKIGKSKPKLAAFHNKLAGLNFFDPACGCGNFLIIAYRELRLLELEVIKAQWGKSLTAQINVDTLILCNVHQFHGIDIDESAVQIATLAMWLVDHQMNLRVQELGLYYNRIPLKKKANIVCANALRLDWESVLKPKECSFIMGNPPFVGYSYQTKAQKDDLALVFHGMKSAGVLDLVAAWHVKAARYIQANASIPVAFVSTNSLTQGEQVAILWAELLKLNIKLHFAHRTFQWNNEGRGVAAVHCVIMGFHCDTVGRVSDSVTRHTTANVGLRLSPNPTYMSCRLFNYGDNIKGEPIEIKATQINPYLVDAPTVLIEKRRKPLNPDVPEMMNGGKPTEGGHLLLSQADADDIQKNDPIAAKYIRPFLMGDEFINNIPRYCLWLKDSTTTDRMNSPGIKKRMEQVKKMRLASPKIATQKLAATPYLFGEIRISASRYLAIPKVSSENRFYIPIGYLDANVICGDKLFFVPNASLFHFGILTSHMHNAWMRAVCGRLESRYSYSNTIVYNNFPFPEISRGTNQGLNSVHATNQGLDSSARSPNSGLYTKIETAAQQILNARTAEENRCTAQGQKYSLATLYAAGNMPTDLLKAHNALDKAVDTAYAYTGGKDDAARVAFLFEQYQKLTAPLIESETPKKTTRIKRSLSQ